MCIKTKVLIRIRLGDAYHFVSPLTLTSNCLHAICGQKLILLSFSPKAKSGNESSQTFLLITTMNNTVTIDNNFWGEFLVKLRRKLLMGNARVQRKRLKTIKR